MKINKIIKYLGSRANRGDAWILIRYFNLIKTLYINLTMLPFKQAIKMPIIIYGKVSFLSLMGKMVIDNNVSISTGMIKFGYPLDLYFNPTFRGVIKLQGELHFKGVATICCGYNINIAENGSVVLGKNVKVGHTSSFNCVKPITIGNYSRIASNVSFMSSSYHFILNQVTNQVFRAEGEIVIGEYNWILSKCTINKGAKTPNNCIVVSGTLLNKDYSQTMSEYSLIGGMPVKLIKNNVSRVWNGKTEQSLGNTFRCSDIEVLNIEDLPIK